MSSGMPDSSPSSKSKKGSGGMKNNDGREGAQTGSKAAFNDKSVGVEPNEGAPELTGKGVIAKLI